MTRLTSRKETIIVDNHKALLIFIVEYVDEKDFFYNFANADRIADHASRVRFLTDSTPDRG